MHIKVPRRLIRDGYIHVPGPALDPNGSARRYRLCIPVDLLEDASTQFLLREEFEGKGYEVAERRILDNLLPSNCLFLDIGAHWGIYSLHVLSAPLDVRVVAVEPDPTNLGHLRYNIAMNDMTDRVDIVAAAAAAENGTQWLRRNTAMGHHLTTDPARAGETPLEVETVTIDSLVDRFDPRGERPIWFKIDVEGREHATLQGATRSLGAGRLGGILWEARVGGALNPDTDRITAFLNDYGMTTREISDDYRLSLPTGAATLG